MHHLWRSLAARIVTSCALALSTTIAGAEQPGFELEGFAAIEAHGLKTTTGGGTAAPISVRTARELQAAVERTDLPKAARQNTPRVVRVEADIDLGELANERAGDEITAVGLIRVLSHTTLYSEMGATLRHGTLTIRGAQNVIIRNLKFRGLWEEDPTGQYDRFGWDYIRIVNSGKTHSHHVWIDHCDFEKVYDGMIDVAHGSDLVTVSWCRFAGDERGPQKKVSLIGHSSSDTAAAQDRGRLNVTLHHNFFENIDDRAPRARFGNIHVYNNVVDGAQYATVSVMGAATLVENSVYRDCRVATSFSHGDDSLSDGKGGTLLIRGSRNEAPRPAPPTLPARNQFEFDNNFVSSTSEAEFRFNEPADWTWRDRHALPYRYRLSPVDGLPESLRQFAGAGKLPAAEVAKTGR